MVCPHHAVPVAQLVGVVRVVVPPGGLCHGTSLSRPVPSRTAALPGGRPGARDDTVVTMSDHSILRTKPVEDVLAQGGDEDDGPGGRASGQRLDRGGASAPST